jgi:acetolactate synthase-1/2/3 large subunit
MPRVQGHGGALALGPLAEAGAHEIFTLSGGHVFPFYDACRALGWPIYDTRHEQTATFAAEAVAKLTRRPGIAVLTAGPGVTNGVSAVTTARFNGSPLVVLGGRAPEARWGSGSLQELDHVPILASVTKHAETVRSLSEVPRAVAQAASLAASPHRGPVFLDFPIDVVFASGEAPAAHYEPARGLEPDPDEIQRAATLLARAERPVVVVGSDVWWNDAVEPMRRLVETLRLPAYANGLGRGCVPADHELACSRTRSMWSEADVVMVVGAPLDFRLGFGRFGTAQVIHVVDDPSQVAGHVPLAAAPAGDLVAILEGIVEEATRLPGRPASREAWIERLRAAEAEARAKEAVELASDAVPIHPARIYGELAKRLERDAVVVGDGGDFVSFAGRLVDVYEPGTWLDPGPFGCLGTGLGYALGARVVYPSRQVVLLAGDGAFGFSGLDVDTLVRHRMPVAIVVGNNGIWGLEKHPMRALYGYDVAADLQPGCRYDRVVEALGGAGETVTDPSELGPALDRALAADVPYLVNVVMDPEVVYPRRSNLA